MKERFIEWNPNSKTILLLVSIIDILEDMKAQGYVLTLRQLYYQLVAKTIIPNTVREYHNLGRVVSKGRLAGLIDWRMIEDRVRVPTSNSHWIDGAQILRSAASGFYMDRWDDQEMHVEVWCFPANTPVVAKNDVVDISSIKIGDEVLTLRGDIKKVNSIFSRKYKGNLLNIQAIGLLDQQVTEEHPYYVCSCIEGFSYKGSRRKVRNPDFVSAGKLKKFDYLLVPRLRSVEDTLEVQIFVGSMKKEVIIPFDLSFCEVIGFYLSEGNIRSDDRTLQFTFNKNEKLYYSKVKRWAKRVGLNFFEADGKGTHIVYISNKCLCLWFEENFGRGAYNKKYPYWSMILPKRKQLKILECSFKGDGYVDKSKNGFYLVTKSRSLAIQTQMMLIRNGFVCSVRTCNDSSGITYRVIVSGKCAEELGCVWGLFINSKRKRASYNNIRIDDKFAYFPIKRISKSKFAGKVFNIEVEESNTYCLPNIVHNCEKDAVSNIIIPICKKWDVLFMANRGYSSQSAMYNAYNRYDEAEQMSKMGVLIYLGDHDPSGMDMARDIADRLQTFGLRNTVVYRVALNMSQIQQYNPPKNPAKITDSRSANYIARYGDSSWELDALAPSVLSQIVEDAIVTRVDKKAFEDVEGEEEEVKARITKIAEDFI